MKGVGFAACLRYRLAYWFGNKHSRFVFLWFGMKCSADETGWPRVREPGWVRAPVDGSVDIIEDVESFAWTPRTPKSVEK
ncbi:hypothetical protein E3N88_00365 [Mikania micrantha]|uniref:Uncharacterized protein n=1 Tax=Mikania micrantha TaxID=192012 RepID=A0A5N6PXW6_9ASTR|nr:hypothetical protein E3N88_00365 [Mikania micrantha]